MLIRYSLFSTDFLLGEKPCISEQSPAPVMAPDLEEDGVSQEVLQLEAAVEKTLQYNNNNNIKDISVDAEPESIEFEAQFNENVRASNKESLGVIVEVQNENIRKTKGHGQKNTYLQDTKGLQDVTIPGNNRTESENDHLCKGHEKKSKVNDTEIEMRLKPEVKDSESQTKQSRPNSFRCRGCGVEHNRDQLESSRERFESRRERFESRRERFASNKEKFEESMRDNQYDEEEEEGEERPRFNSERFRKKKKKAATLDNTQLVSVHHYIGKLVQVGGWF